MIRNLQVVTNKPIEIVTAGAELTRGMAVTFAPATKSVTAATTGANVCFVDVAMNFDGCNAAITPTDADFEEIKNGDLVLKIVPLHGEHYATNQITASGLTPGDPLTASAGKLVKATTGAGTDNSAGFVYVGKYDDPDFDDMYEIYVL